ncbi:heavy metal-associated isoprenylated plant protein 23 [Dendrobium catenatum]|uniref:heavy metal-associated isoprenylated plant protein 23 n=1 Tax=Dendrobium catenatum TaxID=906689 RepID=UPI0009F4A12D|nr:heavy metal-associated isoprenylated plant protein 23 [Dendrobium catenatum]XP_020681478.1 heavy metal-associated isoprenylated plant protein 23 [Dendrobium catenatum]
MGLGGTIEYFSDLFGSNHKHKAKKQLQTVELKVRMDCEGCERKVKKVLSSMKGVKSVKVDLKQQKVTVTGHVDPNKVLKKAQSTGKKSEFWPYVPYSLVAHPYAAQAYDKKAPSGYVRNTEAVSDARQESKQEDQITNIFNDENPNSCSVM